MDVPVSPAKAYTDAEQGNAAREFTPFVLLSTYNVGIFYLLWYAIVDAWNLGNHVAWVRFNDGLLDGKPPSQLYLALVILALVSYFLIGGVLFYRGAKYAKDDKERNRYMSLGVAVQYALTDVPLWLADISIFYFLGWQTEVQSITFMLRTISFLFNSIITWHIYMHRIVKFLHMRLWASRIDTREIALRKAKETRDREQRRTYKRQLEAQRADRGA
jgi:hypothetical protein